MPAYLGQLTAIAVAASADGRTPSRWLAVRHALAYVAGFGAVFTLLGITATFAARVRSSTTCRRCASIGGVILDRPRAEPRRASCASRALERTWRPLDAGAAGIAGDRDRLDRRSPGRGDGPSIGDRLGGRRRQLARRLARVVRARGDLRDRLDAVHRDHPRRDPDAGRDVGHGRSRAPSCWSPTRSGSGCRSSRSRSSTTARRRVIGAARPPRPGRVADRRPAGRGHRRRDGLRLAGPAAALLQLQHGDLSGRATRVHPPARTPRAHRAVQRPPARWPRSWPSSWPSSCSSASPRRSATTGGHAHCRPARHRRSSSAPPTEGLKAGATWRPSSPSPLPDGGDLPADRPRRQPDPPRRPARQGRLAQLLGDLVPAVPVRDADPARAVRALPGPRASCSSGSASRRPRRPTSPLRGALPAAVHDRLRWVRARLPRYKVYGLPTQVFIDPNGVIQRRRLNGPLDEAGAAAQIESMLRLRRARRHRAKARRPLLRLEPEPVAVAHEPPDRVPRLVRQHDRSSPRRRPGRTARPCGRPNRAGSRRTR